MTPRVAVIWIHYHTPELLRESVAAVISDLPCPLPQAELMVVDNGGLDEAPPGTRTIRPRTNTGYAGGINLGLAATRSPHVVVMNPDVIIRPGCVPALLHALQRWPIAGPTLFLDRERRFRLPPTERCDFLSTCVAELGRCQSRWSAYARRRWRRHAHRHWVSRSEVIPTHDLSGAMLAFTRRASETLGPWDESFQLYFEETDWLQRARRCGNEAALVPAAEGIHLYAKSSRNNPLTDQWFADSRRRFERRHFHPWQNRLLRLIRSRRHDPYSPGPDPVRRGGAAPAWFELSRAVCGFPAAAARMDDASAPGSGLTPGLRRQLPSGTYWMRWVDRRGRELGVDQCRI